MFVCLCHGISDKKIRALIESGVTSVQELQTHCKAGANCGSCVFQLKEILEEGQKAMNTKAWPKTGSDT